MKVLRNTKAPPTWNRQGFGFRELRGPAFRATANRLSGTGAVVAGAYFRSGAGPEEGRLNGTCRSPPSPADARRAADQFPGGVGLDLPDAAVTMKSETSLGLEIIGT